MGSNHFLGNVCLLLHDYLLEYVLLEEKKQF